MKESKGSTCKTPSIPCNSELNMDGMEISSLISENRNSDEESSWRSELSKVDVWYASYGSNMWKSRFFCYIEGGKVEGMNRECPGCRDKSETKDVKWKLVPHKLFFGRSSLSTWGPGGAAFLHPETDSVGKAYICMYKITLEQFNDILFQENRTEKECTETKSPLIDLSNLDNILEKSKIFTVEALKNSWYNSVVFLGKENDIPILTLTCSLLDIKRYKSGELPMLPPPKGYTNILIRGLVQGEQFTDEEEAMEYINLAIADTLSKNI